MKKKIRLKNYYFRIAILTKHVLVKHFKQHWSRTDLDLIFQICDELIKNAFKSNYKFIITLIEILKIKTNNLKIIDSKDKNFKELLNLFKSEKTEQIEFELSKINNKDLINKILLNVIKLDNELFKEKYINELFIDKNIDELTFLSQNKKYEELYKIKKLIFENDIFVHIELIMNETGYTINIINDIPLSKTDYSSILTLRKKFSDYYNDNRSELFFIENIDTSGGGHGLGYALIDSIILNLGLSPEKTLKITPLKNKTKIELYFPLVKPTKISVN